MGLVLTAVLPVCAEPSEMLKKIYDALLSQESVFSKGKAIYAEYYPETKYDAELTDEAITISISAMSATGIGVGISNLDVTTNATARATIDHIKSAMTAVSTQRSDLGAVQNRLEHTIANLDNVVENTTAAESRIRDTDMATEMVKFSNQNILQQAGQAMLAQANQSNQGVLSLLG